MRKKNIRRSSAVFAATMLLAAGCSRSDVPSPGATESVAEGNTVTSVDAEPKTDTESETQKTYETQKETKDTDLRPEPVTETESISETDPVKETEEPKYEGPAKELTAEVLEKKADGIKKAEDLDEKAVDGMKRFSVDLFKQAFKAEKAENNILISPESVMFAFGMSANGATGDTLSEMLRTIAFVDDINILNNNLYYYAHPKKVAGYPVQLKVADSVWIDNSDPEVYANEAFLDIVKNIYDAQAFSGVLTQCVDQVNAWVDEHTDGMIKKITDDIDEDVKCMLLNAVCFDAKWADQYLDHQVDKEGIFTSLGGTKQKADMLYSIEDIYISDDNTTGFIKCYEGYTYGFMAMLPSEDISLDEYVDSLTGEKLTALFDNRKSGSGIQVHAKIPEFEYDYSFGLNDPLKKLGIIHAFDSNVSEFTGIMKRGDMDLPLYISDALQITHIELNQAGTRAAAVTAITMACGSVMPEKIEEYTVYLDRPFVYAIVDMETGMPVFMGTVIKV